MLGATNNKITTLYSRLSQEDARMGESLSIENQKSMLLQYCREHHFPDPLFFVDDGYSDTTYDRPDFQRMLGKMEAGDIGIVLTKDLSRLGRNSARIPMISRNGSSMKMQLPWSTFWNGESTRAVRSTSRPTPIPSGTRSREKIP